MTGIMADYKPVVGYLALHARVGILPIYLEGTYEAMPKGTTIIKNRTSVRASDASFRSRSSKR